MLGRSLHHFPRAGRAMDVAGGAGRAAVILGARGLTVTLVDISEVALAMAIEHGQRSRVELQTLHLDLAVDPLPAGPWDLITCFNYLDRALFPVMIESLAPGGQLAVSLATRTNLERNKRPPSRFLLDDGELPSLLSPLSVVFYTEGWNTEGRHMADAMAKKT